MGGRLVEFRIRSWQPIVVQEAQQVPACGVKEHARGPVGACLVLLGLEIVHQVGSGGVHVLVQPVACPDEQHMLA